MKRIDSLSLDLTLTEKRNKDDFQIWTTGMNEIRDTYVRYTDFGHAIENIRQLDVILGNVVEEQKQAGRVVELFREKDQLQERVTALSCKCDVSTTSYLFRKPSRQWRDLCGRIRLKT